MKSVLLCLLAVIGLLPLARAQDVNHAKASLYARADGDDVRIAIEVKIDRNWHLYHGPTREEMGTEGSVGTPTTFVFKSSSFEFSPIRIANKPVAEVQDFGDEKPTIYEHHGTITIHARAKKLSADAKIESIKGTIDGQTCVDGPGGMCLPYGEELRFKGAGKDELFANFPVDLVVGAAASSAPPTSTDTTVPAPEPTHETSAKSGEPATTATSAKNPPQTSTTSPLEPLKKEESLLRFLFEAVFWGLITLLMPCTYPMIPITISYFTKQAATRQTSVLPLSLAYGIGIVLIFVIIGISASAVIIPFATSPITNVLIGGMFVVFALSLFGLFTLQPPRFLLGVAGKASMQGGYFGVFLMGATLVVTSFTCTAPFVGALLGSGASSGSIGRIALGMGVFGLTMAIPFALLSLLPAKAKTLPKSGEWMHTLKVTMGFVELAAALKFLSNADLVWNWGFLSVEMFLLLWVAIFGVAALYLFGIIKLADEHQDRIGPGRFVAGLCFAALTVYSLNGALGNKLDAFMTAIAPPYSNSQAAALGAGASANHASGHTIVREDFKAACDLALKEHKRVLINFTGVTCVNCRLMEGNVFTTPDVSEILKRDYIEARLHTDIEPLLSEKKALQKELTGSIGNPIYVIYDPVTKQSIGRRDGYVLEKLFIEFLNSK